MHTDAIEPFRHEHSAPVPDQHEARTRWVVALTAAMMIGELVVGRLTESMALTADGWHMGSHAGALGLSALGYWFARTRAGHAAFTFGTGKVYAVAGYTSAVALSLIAVLMLVESAERLFDPRQVAFGQALPVAVLGLAVNLVCAKLLHVGHDHSHEHDHDHPHEHDDHEHRADERGDGAGHHAHHDHNLRSAYLHVLADALTSVLAILALVGGRYLGWAMLDPLMGIVGGVVILKWGIGLCRSAGQQLLDTVPSQRLLDAIRAKIEAVGDARVADLHLWDIGPGQRACIVSLVTSAPESPSFYRRLIAEAAPLAHVTVEVERCPGHAEASSSPQPA
jgi:cation diffusion facilitator family transporter